MCEQIGFENMNFKEFIIIIGQCQQSSCNFKMHRYLSLTNIKTTNKRNECQYVLLNYILMTIPQPRLYVYTNLKHQWQLQPHSYKWLQLCNLKSLVTHSHAPLRSYLLLWERQLCYDFRKILIHFSVIKEQETKFGMQVAYMLMNHDANGGPGLLPFLIIQPVQYLVGQ